MNQLQRLLGTAAVAVAAFSSVYAQDSKDTHTTARSGDLKWNPVPSLLPGAQIAIIEGDFSKPEPFIFRLKLPSSYRILPHFHPAIEHVTVLEGTYNVGHGERFDEAELTTLPQGTVSITKAKTPHFGLTKEGTILQIHGVGPWGITYLNPADDPRKKQ